MKIKMLIPAVAIGFTTAAFISCGPSENKVDNANENIQEAKEDLNQAMNDARAEWEKFVTDSREKIRENQEKIAKQREKLATADDAKEREKHREKIAELEAKNNELRRKIDEYKYENETAWQEFKREFNHDMDELGRSIDNVFEDNVK
jgi:predicted  nucleic acid-binding Zn-ribbon protein